MEIFNYCNQCKKSLNCDNFDKKKNGDYYTRCKSCRINHNENEKNKYIKKICSSRNLCNDKNCDECLNKSFASYDGKTENGKLKIDCWHPTKNGNMKPRDITKYSNKKYWFHCDVCNHDFDSSLNNVSGKRWCSYCCVSSRKLCNDKDCNFCFDKSFASYNGKTVNDKFKVDCWHPTKNGNLTPRYITISTGKKYWFKCDNCFHNINIVISGITRVNSWCPYCSIPVQKICNDKSCNHCFNKSFASYNGKTANGKLKVDCFHPTKNGKLIPRNIAKQYSKNCWFQCDVCQHDFNSSLNHITGGNNWCSYCANKKMCNGKDCNYCFNKSFASYNGKTANGKLKVDCFHPTKNGKLTPIDVYKHTHKKYWFQCDVCNHDFNSSLDTVSGKNRWCPYCCIPVQKLCNKEGCTHCFNRSFASYDGKTANGKLKVDCFHPTKNGKLTPRDITISSGEKYWFKCDICCHDFNSLLCTVSRLNSWYPNCKNKTELKLYNWLLKQLNIKEVKKEYAPKWCSTQFRHINKKKKFKNGKYQYRYDFLITFKNNKKLIIELDGPQHFEQVSNWKTPLENQIRDKYKKFLAKKHKISLIRCIQEDVYMERNNWEQKLKKKLKKYN